MANRFSQEVTRNCRGDSPSSHQVIGNSKGGKIQPEASDSADLSGWRPPEEIAWLGFDHNVASSSTTDPRDPSFQFPKSGETLAGCKLQAMLGHGGQGQVFLATQPDLGDRPVVLKVTACRGQEHLALAKLQHPAIVPLLFFRDDPERRVRALAMPYLGGVTFLDILEELQEIPLVQRTGRHVVEALDRLQAKSPIPAASVGPARTFLARATYIDGICWLTACLADGLQFAHERGLVHLDIKPGNILLAADGQALLLDFYLAGAPLTSGAAPPAFFGGTGAYMAPEQREAYLAVGADEPIPHAVDGRADIYSLGNVMFELLAGFPYAVIETPPAPRLCSLNPKVSPGLADIVARCLAVRPNERYGEASQLAGDLRRHLANLPLEGAPNRSMVERYRKWRMRSPHELGILMAALVVLAVGLISSFMVLGLRVGDEPAQNSMAMSPMPSVAPSAQAVISGTAGNKSTEYADEFRRGMDAFTQKQWEESIAAFTTCTTLIPTLATAFYNRGLALAAVGRMNEAQRDFSQALKLDPDMGPASLERGVGLYEAGRFREAMVDFDHALANGVDPATVHFNRALVLRALHNNQQAIQEARQALAYRPRHSGALELLARLQTR